MQTFDQALFNLFKDGVVSYRDAQANATNPADFKLHARNQGLAAS